MAPWARTLSAAAWGCVVPKAPVLPPEPPKHVAVSRAQISPIPRYRHYLRLVLALQAQRPFGIEVRGERVTYEV